MRGAIPPLLNVFMAWCLVKQRDFTFTRWRWVVSFTPRPLYLRRKTPWYPLKRRN